MATSQEANLKVGNQIDVYSESDKGWFIATIIGIKQDQIKIHYFSWGKTWDILINKTSKNIARLNTHTLPIITLSSPPNSKYNIQSNQMVLHRDKIIYLADYGIYQYDTQNNHHSKIISSASFAARSSIWYNQRDRSLYIMVPYSFKMYQFNLKMTMLNETTTNSSLPVILQAMVTNYDKDILHLMTTNMCHMYYDGKRYSTLQKLEQNGVFVHIPSQEKILCVQQRQCLEYHTNPDKSKKYMESEIMLIHGFVKEIETRHVLYYNVPLYLKEMILKYFPCFLYC